MIYPSKEEFSKFLTYNPQSGVLTWVKGCQSGKEAGCVTKKGYRVVTLNYIQYMAHVIAWILHYGEVRPQMLDHINGVKDDNRIDNLRLSDDVTNQQNRGKPKNNTSGYKGVCWCVQTQKWQAIIKADGKRLHLGRYLTKEQAYQAYCNAAFKFHGDFARIR